MGKIATAASGVSNFLTGANIVEELKPNSSYTNQIAAVVFDDYFKRLGKSAEDIGKSIK